MMTMDDLYLEIKQALTYFDLKFNEKDQVEVVCTEGLITFIHEGRRISITTGNVGDKPNETTTKI